MTERSKEIPKRESAFPESVTKMNAKSITGRDRQEMHRQAFIDRKRLQLCVHERPSFIKDLYELVKEKHLKGDFRSCLPMRRILISSRLSLDCSLIHVHIHIKILLWPPFLAEL